MSADATRDAGRVALRELRRTRQLHRLGSLDWFEVAYRVYLFGLFGGGAILWVSSAVGDAEVGEAALDEVLRYGPPLLGLVAALAVLAGLRGGAQGGPLALEAADVAHVMLAPIDRRHTLRRPAFQRVRAAVGAGAGIGAVAGQLAGRRLPGSVLAWFGAGALYGATVGMLWIGGALVAHAVLVRRPLWQRRLATVAGLALVVWQSAALVTDIVGPFDAVGSLALWGWRQHPADLLGTAVALAAVIAGLVTIGGTSLEALARRSSLVAQLRFAVTMQDLRTVILLRRQLNQELTRGRPWLALRRARRGGFTATVMRRGWHGLMRFPVTRLVRMTAFAVALGLLEAAVVRGTTAALAAAALAGFVLGLEVLEPLSQEVDQADRADAMPVQRGELMFRHLLAPFVALVPFALVAGIAAVIVLGSDAIASVAILCLPVVAGTAAGSVVSVVRDAPDPLSSTSQAFVPPEMAGFTATVRLVWPLVVSAAGAAIVLIPRSAVRLGQGAEAASLRAALAGVLFVLVIAYWVKVRDELRRKIRSFMSDGRSYTAAQRASTQESS
jgi:hypothetical protein